jgi:hypothetical protein
LQGVALFTNDGNTVLAWQEIPAGQVDDPRSF